MRRMIVLLSIGIVLLFILSAMVPPIGARPHLKISAERTVNGDSAVLSINYSVEQGRFVKTIQTVCFPVQNFSDRKIFLYTDINNTLDASYPAALGLYDHLLSWLGLFGSTIQVTLVDYRTIPQVLSSPDSVMIFASPYPQDNGTGRELFNWMKSGGIVISVGEYSLPFAMVYDKGDWKGDPTFLKIRYDRLNFTGGEEMEATYYAKAMGFEVIAPNLGIDLRSIRDLGGTNIGYTYSKENETTSLAMFHFGKGSLITFSGDIRNPFVTSAEDVISKDMCKIILSGLAWASGPLSFDVQSFGSGSVQGYFNATMPISETYSILVFSKDNTQPVYGRMKVSFQ